MCGICGELNWGGPADREAVDRLVDGVAHRGPDHRGAWASPGGECALGHARLSIIDLSPAGHQPMVDPLTGNVVVFNGEIYNYRYLRRECEAAGDRFASESDTEVLLALYRRHGTGCLEHLRGMFGLALWDEGRQRLFLARDRVGKKPLNYAYDGKRLVFCSELFPLSRHPGVDTGLDPEALELYLQCQFVPGPWTIYRGIRKLPPAHFAVVDSGKMSIERYWDVDYREKIAIGEEEAADALEERLLEAVQLRMIADVPIGALLSGGVDSSLVVALMCRLSNEPVRTFSIGFKDEAYNELPWAEQAAVTCGTIHHPEVIGGDVAPLLTNLVRRYGEPFADHSAVPSFLVSATIRRHLKVALNGDGGDELLGGYPRYRLPALSLLTARAGDRLVPATRMLAAASRLVGAASPPKRAMRKLLLQYSHPELRSSLIYGGGWNDCRRRRLFPDGPAGVVPRWQRSWLERSVEHADNPVDRMLWIDARTYLQGDLLVKMDIAAMHCGLEARSPLLDHRLIEFCARLPVRYKVRNRIGKYLLKKLASRTFPEAFVHRRKMGFGVPRASWLRGPLAPLVRQILGDDGLMRPLDRRVIGDVVRRFRAGDDEEQGRIWALLMYGLWRREAGGG